MWLWLSWLQRPRWEHVDRCLRAALYRRGGVGGDTQIVPEPHGFHVHAPGTLLCGDRTRVPWAIQLPLVSRVWGLCPRTECSCAPCTRPCPCWARRALRALLLFTGLPPPPPPPPRGWLWVNPAIAPSCRRGGGGRRSRGMLPKKTQKVVNWFPLHPAPPLPGPLFSEASPLWPR